MNKKELAKNILKEFKLDEYIDHPTIISAMVKALNTDLNKIDCSKCTFIYTRFYDEPCDSCIGTGGEKYNFKQKN